MKVARGSLRGLYRAALSAVDPEGAVSRALAEPAVARTIDGAARRGLFAAGKAAAAMARGAADAFSPALVILPRGHIAPREPRIEVRFASHPEPDPSSVQAARRAVEFFAGFDAEDMILCLVSGGASSLLCLPAPGVTLREKRGAVAALARSGASISEINRLRTSLSAIKGGRLAARTRARLVTLVLSDVPGDRPILVGSGPTILPRSGDLVRVIGSNAVGIEAAAARAVRGGLEPVLLPRRLSGEARGAGRMLGRKALRLAPGEALLAGGETSVRLGKRAGSGGRTLELALAAALELQGTRGVSLLAASSDGIDGSSGAAGAFADGTTVERARNMGLDPHAALARHDTGRFFEAIGDLLVTGPTGTNVADWVFALRTS